MVEVMIAMDWSCLREESWQYICRADWDAPDTLENEEINWLLRRRLKMSDLLV